MLNGYDDKNTYRRGEFVFQYVFEMEISESALKYLEKKKTKNKLQEFSYIFCTTLTSKDYNIYEYLSNSLLFHFIKYFKFFSTFTIYYSYQYIFQYTINIQFTYLPNIAWNGR